MKFDFEKFRKVMGELHNETSKNRFDLLYVIAFLNGGEIPKGHSNMVFSTFRQASTDEQRRACDLSAISLMQTAQHFKNFYSEFPQKNYQELSVEEKADIYYLFVVWSKTSLIVQVLQDCEFKRDTLLLFIEESLSEMILYVQKGKIFEKEMYDLLLEALKSLNISKEEFLVLSEEQREAYAVRVLNYHVQARITQVYRRRL
jgi:hypothetical protein